MLHQAVVEITYVVSGGWVTGRLRKALSGEHRAHETRQISCRVEDAPAEMAELVAWSLQPRPVEPTLFERGGGA
jgi:hypothetical protein